MDFTIAPEILVIMTSITFAVGDVIGRLAVRHSSPYTGSLLAPAVTLVVFSLIALGSFSWMNFNWTGAVWFLGAGVFYPGFGIITLFKGFERVGVARTTAIIGVSPLISTSVAVLFMGERPTWETLFGTILIVIGVLIISMEQDETGKRMGIGDLAWPVLSAFCFAGTPIMRKAGMNYFPSPVIGMVISSIGGLVVLLACIGLIPRGQRFSRSAIGIAQYCLTGLIYALGVYWYFIALGRGNVSTLAPLIVIYPLFIIAIMATVFRRMERISLVLVSGAILIVAGAVIITGFG